MATQMTNYQCPACTGPLHFSGESGLLECEYCGKSYTPAEMEALYKEKEAQSAAAKPAWVEEEGMHAYSCPSCGAELLCDETTAATSCPYCGNPNIIPGQFAGARRPDYILPFKLDKESAKKALLEHCSHRPLLPKSFRSENHIEELKGVYVPFWLFDVTADADMDYRATRSSTRREGNYNVTTTEHYEVRRAGTVRFQRIPADGSSKMPDAYMDSIEPFDYDDLKPFSTAYMPGFMADKYDVTAQDCLPRIEQRARESAIESIDDTVSGYDDYDATRQEVSLSHSEPRYALLPVWMLNTDWHGKKFLFAMNGQTGRMIGDLPVSRGRYWAWFAAVTGITWVVLAIILLFIL